MMKTLARAEFGHRDAAEEVQKLREILDQCYAQIRARASQEWHYRGAGSDPSDACVHVRLDHLQQQGPEL